MAKIIPFDDTRRLANNLICREPLEFRRGDWPRGYVLQCRRKEAQIYEEHRRQALREGHVHLRFAPEHLRVLGGCEHTIRAIYRWRREPGRAEEIYFLAGLMECLVSSTCPLLRTDLIRRVYNRVFKMRQRLEVNWTSGSVVFLLPLDGSLYQRRRFLDQVDGASSLKELFETVNRETELQLRLLAREYVFYLPVTLANAFP